jgi:hypothetical protein
MLIIGVETLVAATGCATGRRRHPPDPPSLEERTSVQSMLRIRFLQTRDMLTPQ